MPDGYLYSREAILESLLQQKKATWRKLAAWEVQQQDSCARHASDKDHGCTPKDGR